MHLRGVVFAAAVAGGMVVAGTVLPLDPGAARGVCAVALAVTVRCPPVWPAVAASMGALRATVVQERFERRALHRSGRFEGEFRVEGEAGEGRILGIGPRRFLIAEPPPDLPPPGYSARGLLRLDPVRGRAEPSAFCAERWAAARGLHARARILGTLEGVRETPGLRASWQRAGARVRALARRRLGVGHSAGADLSAALLLGDRHRLEDEVRRGFRHAGLAHVLALSGAHLAVLALGWATLLRTARAPRPLTGASTVLFILAYTSLTGAGPPLVRACATVGLATIGDLLGRRSASVSALGWAGGALLLLHPAWLEDAGFRLSFAATAVLTLFAGAARTPAPPGFRGRLHGLGLALAVSALVTLGTFPEMAGSFGKVSVLAPVTNLLAGPPSAAALGWGGLAAFVPVPDALSQPLAAASARSSAALLYLVEHAARWPGGDLPVPALPAAATLGLVAVTVRAARGGRPGRRERIAWLIAALAAAAASGPHERMTVLDVGQGDSVLVEGGGGTVLVDCGPPGQDGYESAGAPAVRRRIVRALDALVITHGHLDHLGGAEELLAGRGFRTLVVRPADPAVPGALATLEDAARARGARVVSAERPVELLGRRVRILAPFGTTPPASADENDRSLAGTWRAPAFTVDLFGDGARPPQDALRRGGELRPAPIVLLPHHGSRENTDAELLADTGVRLALISCGTGNTYGHPHRETLDRLRAARVAVLRTDLDGSIRITATRRGFRLHWIRAWPGPRALFPSFALRGNLG